MDLADWTPSVEDVGAVIRARTKDRNGNEPGTFTSISRPTGDQVSDLADTVVADIHAECGPIPDLIQDNARRVAALGTACLVELTFWPEQVGTSGSPYDRLYARYLDAFKRLKTQVSEANGGDLNDIDVMPEYGFPMETNPCRPVFTDWSSQW